MKTDLAEVIGEAMESERKIKKQVLQDGKTMCTTTWGWFTLDNLDGGNRTGNATQLVSGMAHQKKKGRG